MPASKLIPENTRFPAEPLFFKALDINVFVSYDTNTKTIMKQPARTEPITPAEYRAFQQAYDFFNRELFGGSLPHVLVTLQRHAKARGYFSPERFSARHEAHATAHELAMNPDTFTGRTDEEILSTLAHEMAHVWQQAHGQPPRRSYHDRQWAAKMKEIGLQPSTTGEPGGKETGQSVTHYIARGGPYARAYAKLKDDRLSAPLAIRAGEQRRPGQGEEGQQDEIHLPGMRPERLGQGRRRADLRRLLRGWRGRGLFHAGRGCLVCSPLSLTKKFRCYHHFREPF